MPLSIKAKALHVLWALLERGETQYTALVFTPEQGVAWIDWDRQGNHSHIDGATIEDRIDHLYQILMVDRSEVGRL